MINLSEFGYSILQIETIAGCNMACAFCPYPIREDKLSELSDKKVQEVIESFNPNDDLIE